MFFRFILFLLAVQSATAYTLSKSYNVSNFFTEFDFFTAADPTHGDVQYVAQSVATAAGLVGTRNGAGYMGVDYKTLNPAVSHAHHSSPTSLTL